MNSQIGMSDALPWAVRIPRTVKTKRGPIPDDVAQTLFGAAFNPSVEYIACTNFWARGVVDFRTAETNGLNFCFDGSACPICGRVGPYTLRRDDEGIQKGQCKACKRDARNHSRRMKAAYQ